MLNLNKKGITIVELLVVIVILLILMTISYMSLNSYIKNSRDINRKTNITNLEKVLTIENIEKGVLPYPDSYKEVFFNGKPIIKSGIIGNNLKSKLDISNSIKDPKFGTDFSYSVTEDRQSFEIGSVSEYVGDPTSGIIEKTYAESDIYSGLNTKLKGNYNGQYIKIFSGGELSVISIPSITINGNTVNSNLIINEINNYFSVDGTESIPDTYGDVKEENRILFTPRLLFKGYKCGVETDQEIVNFVANLYDSYNMEPFNHLDKYKNIFEDFNFLRDNLIDFSKLEILGRKINKSLGCDIENFKTTDIFPIACGVENGIFDLMSDNFDMTNSCLYKYVSNSSGSGIVKEGIGNLGTKGLSLYTSVNGYKTQDFKYRFFAYIPFKFKFDYKAIFHNVGSTGRIKFYIDDVEFATFNKNTANITNFKTFETQLLRPGIKEMKWTIGGGYYGDTELFLDNLQFGCANGESNCGWTDYTLDLGDELPWDIYSFGGDAGGLTWDQTTDRSEGTHAIISPDFINRYSSNYITKNIKFSTPKKLSFSYKGLIPSDGYVEFYIDGVRYLYADNATPGISGYKTYTTPLLQTGNHEFKWLVNGGYYKSIKFYLDDIKTSCSGGGGICGWTDYTLDLGDKLPWDIYSFGGDSGNLTWDQTTDKSEGTHAIISPDFINRYSSNYITKNITFTTPKKLTFSYKGKIPTDGYVEFYIDGVRYLYADNATPGISNYQTYTTPLLQIGNYNFTWRVQAGYYKTIKFYLDDIKTTN